ncbi:hypothetical protein FGW37_33065 [Streptomyces rectiverticillatus]|uniref:hypothetical protein n=1 Tax=Streptomyces rectiverticillatus TaxID=173860 RepID=UPI0015C31C4B|nr:hypothetical protein [Streptomyces rectiverticillatus]QLE75771.1 hypothetical protein FGW37_33065 [Streptomyces rectiverticillatus]
MTRTFGVVMAVCVVGTMGLTACGGGRSDRALADRPAAQVLDAAVKEFEAAHSVHYDFEGVAKAGAGTSRNTMTIDNERNCRATFTTSSGTSEILKFGEQVWFKADRKKWTKVLGDSQAVDKLAGRYLHGTTSSPQFAEDMSGRCDFETLQDNVRSVGAGGRLTKGAPTVIDGKKTIPVVNREGRATVYVATEGKPYPVRIVREGESAGTMTLTDWDRPVSTTTPPASETLEADKLAGLAGRPSHHNDPSLLF